MLPDLSKITNNIFIKDKIIKNIKSLNKILIYCVLINLLFFERFFYDLKINLFINIENFFIFKLILLAAYLSILGQIFISFQIAKSYLKIPTIINFALIILSISVGIFFITQNQINSTALLYLFMNALSLMLNIIFLHYSYKKIFTNNFIWNIIKNSFYNVILSFLILNILDKLIYDISKIMFYLILSISLLYFFYLSQKIIKS